MMKCNHDARFSGVLGCKDGCLACELEFQGSEVERLKAGNFTPEELQNLCHNLSDEDYSKFCDGCDEYQRKLFGKCRTEECCK